MNLRQQELAHFGNQLQWLEEADAADVYRNALLFMSKDAYALSEKRVVAIEIISAVPGESLICWLEERLTGEFLQVVFGHAEVCVVTSSFLLQHWQDMFMPARDDVVVLPLEGNWVMYFSHEEEVQYGDQKA